MNTLSDNELTSAIIGCAVEVHREIGPGMLESSYEYCLGLELASKGLTFEVQKQLPLRYKGRNLDCGYRIDVLVENRVILELKSVESLTAIHEAQLLSYLRMSKLQTGLLINFNVPLLKQGIRRMVNAL